MTRARLKLLAVMALHDAARVAFIGGALAPQRRPHPDGFDGHCAALNVMQAIREALNEDARGSGANDLLHMPTVGY